MTAIAKRLTNLETLAGIRPTDVAFLANTNIETVSRWRSGKNAPQGSNERLILDIEYILERLREFYERDDARLWLYTRQKALQGKAPADLIHEGRVSDVLDLIQDLSELNFG
jgi:transcriptional regulator with XRE-family HTH domain